jgi:hypothetical protein
MSTYRLDTGIVADWQITQRLGGNCVRIESPSLLTLDGTPTHMIVRTSDLIAIASGRPVRQPGETGSQGGARPPRTHGTAVHGFDPRPWPDNHTRTLEGPMTNEPDHRPDSPTISGVCPAVEPPSKQPDHIFEPYDANPGICRHCGAVKPFPCYAS